MVDAYIADGRRLVEALDSSGFDVSAAFWHHWPDSDEWRLVIASPTVAENGPKAAYTHIRSLLSRMEPPLDLTLEDISVQPTNATMVERLGRVVAPFAVGSAARRGWAGIADAYIFDDYVYRVR